ncbi:MAG: acylphosphatase [Kineosporiaceae bacterium]
MISGPTDAPDVVVRLTAVVRGRVQGVGFRWWTRSRALELGLVGSATNRDDGSVEVIAVGRRAACEQLLALLSVQPAPPVPPNAPRSYYRRPGHVNTVSATWAWPGELPTGFVEG